MLCFHLMSYDDVSVQSVELPPLTHTHIIACLILRTFKSHHEYFTTSEWLHFLISPQRENKMPAVSLRAKPRNDYLK